MRLHENKELFEDAIIAASQRLDIPQIYIEKDYWVTLALHRIFSSDAKAFAIFKGGTALSKCHKLIDRFSEDIDIVVIREEQDNGNRLKNKLKAVTGAVDNILPEIQLNGITNKLGMIRKTAHQYPKLGLDGVYGEVREHIIIEATWLGTFEPFVDGTVGSYILEMMEATNQQEMIKEYGMTAFPVRVLSKERTFSEKVMSLVRFSLTETPYEDLSRKIRHTYDLNRMLENGEVKTFFESEEFFKMLNMVGGDDIMSFKNNNAWLKVHPSQAMVFKSPADTWSQIRQPYQTTFKDLVNGDLPDESVIINTLDLIGTRLKKLNWELS
jgi:predicted nucleotidyltransferase component of viral defense system